MNWKLESAKMFGYLAFPVVCFITFNHPKFYQSALEDSYNQNINYEALQKFQSWRKEQDKLDMERLVKDLEK